MAASPPGLEAHPTARPRDDWAICHYQNQHQSSPACIPASVGGNVLDFGNISAAMLSPDAITSLPGKVGNYTITCDADVQTAMKFIDNRAASAPAAGPNFGLGTQAHGEKIGYFQMHNFLGNIFGNGAPVDGIFSKNSGETWIRQMGGTTNYIYPLANFYYAFSPSRSLIIDLPVFAFHMRLRPVTADPVQHRIGKHDWSLNHFGILEAALGETGFARIGLQFIPCLAGRRRC
ncbi:DUF1120 domain-containing protein [Collimonas sp. NPDC087041]|uniref:DUF1120 domain-containing protein n=1 Tax=Collimonas sp. NPDC087041 TaxID=3363960 RepID=UPI0038287E10